MRDPVQIIHCTFTLNGELLAFAYGATWGELLALVIAVAGIVCACYPAIIKLVLSAVAGLTAIVSIVLLFQAYLDWEECIAVRPGFSLIQNIPGEPLRYRLPRIELPGQPRKPVRPSPRLLQTSPDTPMRRLRLDRALCIGAPCPHREALDR